MTTHLVRFAVAAVCLLPAAFAQAAINDLNEAPRVFNDFPGSTLTITNNYPTDATIDDRLAAPGPGANRHDLRLSADGGATAHTFDINQGWKISAIVSLDAAVNSPRKEAGLRVNSPITGDALFIINTDGAGASPGSGTGEIVAFGGGAEFFSFHGGPQDNYTVGTEILMGMIYSGGPNGSRTLEYYIDRTPLTPGGIERSGPLLWQNLENGPVNYNLAYYGQWAPANTDDFMTATFRNFTFIPEPTSLLLSAIGLIGLVGIGRRSKN